MKISIVTTLYNSEKYIVEFYRRISSVALQVAKDDYEIIFVNDGSPDDSLAKVLEVTRNDPHVLVVDLSRNFGHHKAIMAGLGFSKGSHVFLIDSDLEEDPRWLLEFYAEILACKDIDVVYGVQEKRKGGSVERLSGRLFWSLINSLSGLSLSPNLVTARVMTRRYVNALLEHREKEVFLAGIWQITGFNQKSMTVNKSSSEETTYTLKRKLSLATNSITSFSALPLIGIFLLGIAMLLLSISYTIYLFGNWLVFSEVVAGWTSLMVSIWFLGGVTLSSMGVIGIYLSKVFSEVKNRPYTIVKQVYGRE